MQRERKGPEPDSRGPSQAVVQRSPGKSTLTGALPAHDDAFVQAKGEFGGPEVHQAAARGVAGSPGALPHGDRIQQLFGHHDISGIGAHVGGAAAHATGAIGATAYATGDQVAFGATPDLHTAAHEAAHVVQQRGGVQLAGGVGASGDTYERHADAVADAVVAGQSAQGLLDPFAGGGPSSVGVQRKDPPSPAPAPGVTPPSPPPPAAAAPAPVGHAEVTEFGTYWVVPAGTAPQAGVTGEQISETDFTAVQAVWAKIKSGAGQIKIRETATDGTDYPGFKDKMVTQFGKLLSKPIGRQLVTGLISAGHSVTILPSGPRTVAAARRGAGSVENADGSAGAGGDSTIMIEAGLTDTDIVCKDPAGNTISSPIFLILGHELIHAVHNDAGRNQRNKAATDASYSNREEEETIATGAGITENKIRGEHGLGVRKGHGGTDTR